MSSFSDTFTKNQDGPDDILNYDNSAAYYFGATVLACIVLPWSWLWIRHLIWGASVSSFPKKTHKFFSVLRYVNNKVTQQNLERIELFEAKKLAKNRNWTIAKLITLGFCWILWFYCCLQLTGEDASKGIQTFNPFDILGIEPGVDDAAIKKAYRKMSLLYHPDKNPDDPLASAKFMQVSKAHKTLTDPAAKANYEKYGNPDGPQTTKVGIGLPRFLLEKKNHLFILFFFFITFLIVIPAIFIMYYQRQKDYAPNGVFVETLQFMGHYISDQTRLKNCPELLAASAESRKMETRPEDEKEMKQVVAEVQEHQRAKFTMPIIVRNTNLIWAHMQRLHHLLSPELKQNLDELLRHVDKITTSMIEIACMREWLATAQSVIEFRRCIIQALDVKSNSLLQIPHFTEENVKHCLKGNNPIKEILTFLQRDKELRRGVANLEPDQLLDIDEFAAHFTMPDITATAVVEGEKTICKDDIATITVKIARTQLEEGEALGYVHAPFFPDFKIEEWYIFLCENSKIICYEKVRTQERIINEKMRFHVGRKGKHNLQVICMCDSYAGLDKTIKVEFDAILPEEDKERSIYVHPEDEKLDDCPTLFQQLVGDMGAYDESEDEEEDEDDDDTSNSKSSPGDGDKKKNSPEKKKDNSDSDSDSDSESDSESDSDVEE
ncbi:unnamed protein product [Amoebophrya sp. A120]|nr:unnamed protein product [Amoebophrya sp. A120]|eukprot:GSA120T00009232001.1